MGKWGKQTASRVSELEKNMAAEYDLEGKILQYVSNCLQRQESNNFHDSMWVLVGAYCTFLS